MTKRFARSSSSNLRSRSGRGITTLERTINITAWDGTELVGCLRILTDGCFFGTIPEVLVLPRYQRQGIGSALLRLAKQTTPTLLYFGAQPQAEPFYEKNGCTPSLRAFEMRPEE